MEDNSHLSQPYDFIIVGAGIAGAKLFYHLSQFASCLLIEKKTLERNSARIAKVVCMHDFSWMDEVPIKDSSIFIRDHWTSVYASRNLEACVDGHEWGAPLAKMVDYFQLVRWYLSEGEKQGGTIRWGAEVENIENSSATVVLQVKLSSSTITVEGQMMILATGSTGYHLNQQVGCATPTLYNTISATFTGTKSQIMKNVPQDYIYRLHPQISSTGMLWLNRGSTYFNIGFLSQESHAEMGKKFLRILQNYAPLQPFFHHLSPRPPEMTSAEFSYGVSPRYPITKKVANRVLIIGDAAGLLYPLYFEGIVGAVVSATIAGRILKSLHENHSHYTEQALEGYQIQLHKNLDSYLKMGAISDEMFFKGGEKPPFTIWESYLQAIKEIPQVRKNIWTAYQCPDLGNYPEENDKWCGEQIYKRLPLAKKVTLAPFFLKFK